MYSVQTLHDRYTRGDLLSTSEQAELEAWYVAQDEAEREAFAPSPSAADLAALRSQLDSATTQLAAVGQTIHDLVTINLRLKEEIEEIQGRLAHRSHPHAA